MSSIPENLKYTKEHEWVSASSNIYTMGITDFAQSALGDIVYVQLPKVGEALTAGTVTEINSQLSDTPELLNCDPYGAGWLIKVDVVNEPADLLDAGGYAQITA